ncbi:M57 family metalloprotease [Pedobacter sp. KR3-3]|uniref:M57 family metalloprotease n=1 Tax=Pedobacter albus TaxID=3113905 RepID=A0ABU7ICY0_9SPHI|nr:M57 family metalloprotease [Pedobacter sp. KR3-3]MEE1947194.1 M57 family metalloprotease [Pedobacter sp. KR3-3]
MKGKKTLKLFLLITLTLFTLASCKKSQEPLNQESKSNKVLEYITSLGFPLSSIKDSGNEYIVDGDISFSKDMEIPTTKSTKVEKRLDLSLNTTMSLSTNSRKIGQYYTGTTISPTNRINIRIFVDPSMTSMNNEINSAIDQWNNVNADIIFTIVANGAYDILIKDENLGTGSCGQARFPLNGKPGNLIRINKNYISGNSFDQRQRTIAHELGHCIGFRHTNWASNNESKNGSDDAGTQADALDVPGVGGTDASSLMNGKECGIGSTVLSQKDKLALLALYPKTYYSIAINGNFTQANCTIGTPDVISYTLPAGVKTSTISQADADQQAANIFPILGQNFADNNGSCGGTMPTFSLTNIPTLRIDVTPNFPDMWYYKMELRNYQTGQVSTSTGTPGTYSLSVPSTGDYGVRVIAYSSAFPSGSQASVWKDIHVSF